MKNLLASLALCASLSASAQVVYPYNPDANGDSAITSGDLLDFLPMFATTFTLQGITVDGVPLDEWLVDLQTVVLGLQAELNAQNAIIDSLQNAVMTRDSVFDIAVGVAWRGELAGADLSGIDFTGGSPWWNPIVTNFAGADFSGADLSGVNLSHVILSGANLSDANLSGATMDCLLYGCPSSLPTGYICEGDNCLSSNQYRIIPIY